MKRLGFPKKRSDTSVFGVGETPVDLVKGEISCEIKSMYNNFMIKVNAVILAKVTSSKPSHRIALKDWSKFQHLPLADPRFYEPGTIDILLSTEEHASIMKEGLVKPSQYGAIAQNTEFGYIISGVADELQRKVAFVNHVSVLTCNVNVEGQIKRFLQIEETPDVK